MGTSAPEKASVPLNYRFDLSATSNPVDRVTYEFEPDPWSPPEKASTALLSVKSFARDWEEERDDWDE